MPAKVLASIIDIPWQHALRVIVAGIGEGVCR